MNLIEKSRVNKQLKEIKKINGDVKTFLDHIKNVYKISGDDENNLNQVKNHMDNLNVIFSQMQLGIKNNIYY